MISISVEYSDGEKPPLDEPRINNLIMTTMDGEGRKTGAVQIIFVTDDELRTLKLEYFDQDVFTDVISFNLNSKEEELEGEIYISSTRALENASLYDQTHEQELMRLIVHGTLHLLGYDDLTEAEQLVMRKLEDRYVQDVAGKA